MEESSDLDLTCNEHDYSSRLEVPLEAIKTEILDPDECSTGSTDESPVGQDVTRVPILLPAPVIGNYSQRPNFPRQPKLPKLRPKFPTPKQFMVPPRQTVLLPRPVIPRMQLPPPIPPNIRSEQPANCKGVLIVQDVKFCTMYVPKGDKSGTMTSTGTHSIPIPVNALSKAVGVSQNVIASSVSASLSQATPLKPTIAGVMNNNDKDSSKVPKVGAPLRAIASPRNIDAASANPLLWNVQKFLCDLLPMFWFCAVEKNGINVMLLSYGTEKAIQRRLYVSSDGKVEISVHCKPIPELLIETIVEKAATKTSLTESTVKQFSDWIVSIVQVLRDFQICVGLERPDYRETLMNSNEIELDKNPYQEVRYTETMRSVNCIRLVEITRRRCNECAKSLQSNRRQNKLSSAANQQKKGDVPATTEESGSNKIVLKISKGVPTQGNPTETDPSPHSDPDWVEPSQAPKKLKKRKLKQSASRSKKKQELIANEVEVESSNE